MDPRQNLRLVGSEDPGARARWRREDDVADENRRAARIDMAPTDPRWIVAARTATELEGAALPPERRERILRSARTLGLRTFDANLIIAIVQDCARRGQPLDTTRASLDMIGAAGASPAPSGAGQHGGVWLRAAIAVISGLTGTALLIWWLTG